ncbi:OsmC family protein [Roseiarcaceae bacterium H3SJ34-1]|uniref:OsmC family protein n=1 Tax=Terripilifer ovatus TaxID=3032367 RepID=UPI003AB99AED|nr:OsmC family protein [Roseiarcaceae bacterium H3SJ34-1]
MAKLEAHSAAGYAVSMTARTHALNSDEPVSAGGGDTGPAPYELILAGLASCTSITLRMYADRKGWPLGQINVDVRILRDAHGAEKVERHVSFSETLSEEQRARLAEISEKTPVTKTLKQGLTIVTTVA